jgi:quinoprotein glucose dehydrogenase
MQFIQGGDVTPTVDGIPLVKPLYGRITAIDLTSGDHLWQVANGDTPDAIKNHPLLKGVEIEPTGKPTRSGLVLTKSLLFSTEGPGGDAVLHARDKTTGESIARIALPASATGLPMTYMHDGKQYLVVTVSNFREAAKIVALTLPD